jgi:probable rRNA maturation factor
MATRVAAGPRVTEDRGRSLYLPPWRIDLVERPTIATPVSAVALARAAAAALHAGHAPSPGSVTVVLTNDEELAELNREHMGHDEPTDVLSFPMLAPSAFGRDGGTGETGAAGTRAGRTHIGDIAISVERAVEQAHEGRGGQTGDVSWSAADEMRLLVTHGVLHLCGWDHAEPAEETEMRALERRLLR